MSTKSMPGPFNCYAAAMPDEPIFTILGRDAAGPATIRFWCSERARLGLDKSDDDISRIATALGEANQFAHWREANLDPMGDGKPTWKLPLQIVGEGDPIRVDPSKSAARALEDAAAAYRALVELHNRPGRLFSPGAQNRHLEEASLLQQLGEALGEVEPIEYAMTAQFVDEGDLDPRPLPPMFKIERTGGVTPDTAFEETFTSPAPELHRRLADLSARLHDGRLPMPYDLYRAVKSEDEPGWSYEPLGFGVTEIDALLACLPVDPLSPVDHFFAGTQPSRARPPVVDEAPHDLAHSPEVPPHRFSQFFKGENYAYARGLEVNPTHLPVALDEMAKDGWRTVAVFGQTDSQHVGFLFERIAPKPVIVSTLGPFVDTSPMVDGISHAQTAIRKHLDNLKGKTEIAPDLDIEIWVKGPCQLGREVSSRIAMVLQGFLGHRHGFSARAVGLIDGQTDAEFRLVRNNDVSEVYTKQHDNPCPEFGRQQEG